MHVRALLWQGESEHLHLRELVHAVEAAGGPAVGASLGAEAVADSTQLQRQFVRLEDSLMHRSAERDLGSGHQ